MVSDQFYPFQYFLICRVRHDPRKFHYILSLFHKDSQNLVINPVPFHRALSVAYQYGVIVFYQTSEKFFYTAPSKKNFCLIFIYKVIHFLPPLLLILSYARSSRHDSCGQRAERTCRKGRRPRMPASGSLTAAFIIRKKRLQQKSPLVSQ